jgi:hypothetical protein
MPFPAVALELPWSVVYSSRPSGVMSLVRDSLRALTSMLRVVNIEGYPADAFRFAALFEK